MTERELFETLREKLMYLAEEHGLMDKEINVNCRALTPEEAIGIREALEDPSLLTEITIDGISERFDRAQAREELKELEIEESRLTRGSRLYQVVLK